MIKQQTAIIVVKVSSKKKEKMARILDQLNEISFKNRKVNMMEMTLMYLNSLFSVFYSRGNT